MTSLHYTLDPDDTHARPMGLVVLQADETIEPEYRRHFAEHRSPIYTTRIPSSPELTRESLIEMETALTAAAGLLPREVWFGAVGYACTSASSVIGSERVEELVQLGCRTRTVTDPLRATVACCARSPAHDGTRVSCTPAFQLPD